MMNNGKSHIEVITYPWINSLSCGSNSSSRNLFILLDIASTAVIVTLIFKSNLWTESETTSTLLDSEPFWTKSLSLLHSLSYTTLSFSSSWNWWNHKQFRQKLTKTVELKFKIQPEIHSKYNAITNKTFVIDEGMSFSRTEWKNTCQINLSNQCNLRKYE